jgi:5-methylcytosine-specific restriction endonuclease McrA
MTAKDAAAALRGAADSVAEFADKVEAGKAKRDELDQTVAEIVGAQRRHFGPRPRARRGEGGRHKLLAYLRKRVGQVVYGEELAAIAGIGEWARRIRELRDEYGYEITELGGSAYRLESAEPDKERAREWQLANKIRRRRGSGLSRISAFLEAKVEQVVTREQLDYVARIKEGSRRVRELRDEHGWPINSHIDEAELRPGEYRLVSADPADHRDPRQRLYPEDLRERVFARDNYTCQRCGRNREKALAAGDTRFYLEIHHKTAVAEELDVLAHEDLNKEENLVTLCHRDHKEETGELQERRRRERRGVGEADG